MRINSLLYIAKTQAGGKNEWAESTGAKPQWSSPIPCHIRNLTDNRLGKYEDGVYHQASYNILTLPIEGEEMPLADVRQVMLVRRGVELGIFNVISVEAIETQNRLQIVV